MKAGMRRIMIRTAKIKSKNSWIMIMLIFSVITCAAAGCSQKQKQNTDTSNTPLPATTASNIPSVQEIDGSQSEELEKENMPHGILIKDKTAHHIRNRKNV